MTVDPIHPNVTDPIVESISRLRALEKTYGALAGYRSQTEERLRAVMPLISEVYARVNNVDEMTYVLAIASFYRPFEEALRIIVRNFPTEHRFGPTFFRYRHQQQKEMFILRERNKRAHRPGLLESNMF